MIYTDRKAGSGDKTEKVMQTSGERMTRGRLDGRMERWLRWRGGGSLGQVKEDRLIDWRSS